MKKLKAWLIHKLGGMAPADIPPVKKKEVEIIDIHASIDFDLSVVEENKEEFQKWKNERLCYDLAKQLFDSALVKVEAVIPLSPYKPPFRRETATIYVIPDFTIENCDSLTFNKTMPRDYAEKLYNQRSNYGAW